MINNLNKIKADYKYWVKWNDWDISQMTALLLGYNPTSLHRIYIDKLVDGVIETSLNQTEIELFVEEYEKAHNLIMNSIETGKLKFRTTPKRFYDWALVKNLPLTECFHNAMKNKKPIVESSGLDIKRKNQLYKIILSMAIQYKFNPQNLKNPSTSRFRNAIERAGLSIDDNTIRDVVLSSYEHYKEDLDHSVFEN